MLGGRRIFLSFVVAFCVEGRALPEIPGVENHWVANSGGTQFMRIQNFIEEMVVKPDGSVLTWSFYDEGLAPNSIYRNGAWAGHNWQDDTGNPHPSRRAIHHGKTWNILNFHGRGFMGNVAPPPTGAKAPMIVSSTGDTIRSVADPTAIAFDSSGRLLVGDNGPDQDIKIFQVPTTESPGLAVRLVGTIGEKGGVFAHPRGVVGPRRFWGIRGIGVDASGRLYVGCTGMPAQVGGGTHIRAFSDLTASNLLWEVMGLAFVNTVDADPDSGGTSLHKNSTRFHMDWSKPPGKSWSFASVTTDPFTYPDDPRLVHSLESVWFRRIHGKRYLFLTDMYSNYMAVIRFEDSSEVGIPTAFLPVRKFYRDSGAGSWALDRRPIWGKPTSEDDHRRWMWRDDNGDGQVQREEFHTFDLVFPYTFGMDVDDSGDIWWSGGPYMVQFPAGKLDSRGVAEFDTDSIRLWRIPYNGKTFNNYVVQCKYLRSVDRMLVASAVADSKLGTLFLYDDWSRRAKPFPGWGQGKWDDTLVEKWRMEVPSKFIDPDLSLNADALDTALLPDVLAADPRFFYIGYVDKGPDGRRNGEVSVYSLDSARRIGWIAPGASTGFFSGWFDLWHAVNVLALPNQERILMAEEDFGGKINVYRWCPDASCPSGSAPPPPPPPPPGSQVVGEPRVRIQGGQAHVEAASEDGWRLSLLSVQGRVLLEASGTGATRIPFPSRNGLVFARIAWAGGGRSMPLVVSP